MRPSMNLSVYLIIGCENGKDSCLEIVTKALDGGVTVVQLRDKVSSIDAIVETGRELKSLLHPRGVPLIINDRVDVALAVEADGVHVGQSDMHPSDVRRLIRQDMLLGLSITNLEELQRFTWSHEEAVVDYLGVGPVYETTTKTDCKDIIGMKGVAAICAATALPKVAVGGLDAGSAGSAIAAGCDGVAVSAAIAKASDPAAAARDIATAVERAKEIL